MTPNGRTRLATGCPIAAMVALAMAGLAGCSTTSTGGGSSSSATTSSATSAASSTSASASPSASSATSSTTSPSSPSTPALPPGAKTLAVAITGKTITPPPTNVQLKVGQTLRLVVTDNEDNVFHAHGFDKEVNLVAGKPAVIDLMTRTPGAYEVETHHPELKLLTVLVR